MPKSKQSITFVIGAGASYEVGMPTGQILKADIAKALSFKDGYSGSYTGSDLTVKEAIYKLSNSDMWRGGDLNEIFKAARLISNAMPQAPSIDNFIDSHRANPGIATCGKLAIASEILKAEKASKLFFDPSNARNTLKFQDVEATWFNAFFQLLTLNTQFEDISERLGRVKIVTFNYDRTLEHFLHQSMQNYYGCSYGEATKALNSLVILHPYGSVGVLPWQETNAIAVPFGGELLSDALLAVSTTLRTFTERTSPTDDQITHIRSSVVDADTLVFLGFAYHELNLELLYGNSANGPASHTKQVFGTATGISESNKKAITNELIGLGRYDPTRVILRRELKAAEIIPEYSRSLNF